VASQDHGRDSGWEPDAAKNRRTRSYSRQEMLARVAWAFFQPLFRFSPRPAFGFRRALLKLFGARIGQHVHVYASARIRYPWMLTVGDWSAIGEDVLIYNLGPVALGERVTVSYRAHLCAGTHDLDDPGMPLLRPPIRLGDNAWVGTDAFIGPGVDIGKSAIVGARAVVTRDVAPGHVVAGNPARVLRIRPGFESRRSP
jgi:putative colanic acid biosynthesis acetyltransferase WcaF